MGRISGVGSVRLLQAQVDAGTPVNVSFNTTTGHFQ